MTILEELYYGNLNPTDIVTMPSKETDHMLVLVDKQKRRLEEAIDDEEQRNALNRYIASSNELSVLTECEAFIKGFSIATKILAEAMR